MTSCPSCGAPTDRDARFCASCGTALQRRCGACGTALPEGARFCPSCGASTVSAAAASSTSSDEERKVVTVIFADLVGFTAASDGADPEDMRRRLSPYHEAIREEVERYGGRVEKLMGDGVLAVFGAPTVHEDDAERAVRSGLRIQERIAGMRGQGDLSARVAIGTGEAVVAIDGTTMDREGLVGDVVNTTSRLQHEAPPGTVLVDEATYRVTRRAFTYEERPPVLVRGKADPLSVWLAVQPVGRYGVDVEDVGVELVGRASELKLLTDAFSRTVDDSATQVVTIVGEPGVGKSRMVRELRRHIDDLPDLIRWRQGRCLPYGEGITYWAMGEIVKAEAGILETDPPGTALGKLTAALEPLLPNPDERLWVSGRLAPLVGAAQESAVDRSERFAAWNRYLAAMGEQRPTVVVIEDLHWADSSLVEFLAAVPEAMRGIPLLLVCTARPDFFSEYANWGAGQRNAVTLHLDPLGHEETARLLDALLEDESLDEDARRGVLERSGGNPLWAQEFVRMVRDQAGEVDGRSIPDTVQAVVAARIDLLDADAKTVIQAASILGKSFWRGAVQRIVDESLDVDEALRELSRRELIRRERSSTVAGEVEFAFTHTVVQEVARGQSPRAVRMNRHHRAARWLEEMAGERVGDRAEVIAHHDAEALRLASAADLDDIRPFAEAAITSHLRAGEQLATLDGSAARVHLEAALDLVSPGDPRRGRLLRQLGDTLTTLGQADAGFKVLLEARDELDAVGDIEGWGLCMSRLGQASWIQGDPGGAAGFEEEAIARLEQHPPGPAIARVYSHVAGRLWLRGDSVRETLDYIDKVRPVIEVHGDVEARGRLLMAEGGARFDSGDASAVEPFRTVLRISMEADHSQHMATSHLNLGEQLRTGWGLVEALPTHLRGLEIATSRHLRGAEQFLRASIAIDYVLTGEWDEALRHVETALQLPERLGYMEAAFQGPRLAVEMSRTGGDAALLAAIDGLVADSEGLGDLQAVVPALDGAAQAHFVAGDSSTALALARRIVELSGGSRYLVDAWGITTWVLAEAGELQLIEAVLPALRAFEMPRPRAQVKVLDALLATDGVSSVDEIVEAADELAAMKVAYEAMYALAHAARVADGLGDTERARALRSQAREALAPARAEALFARLGL